MRRLAKGLLVFAAVLLVGVVAACGQSAGNGALGGLSPARSALSRTASGTSSPQPSATSAATQPSPTPAGTTAAPVKTKAAAPATKPQSSVSAPPSGSGSSSSALWLWVILGAVVVLGAVIGIVMASRHRSAATAASADWRSRVIDAFASGAALHDAMSVAETPGALASADAGARWSDIQRRADDLAETLYALREAAPDEQERSRIADVLATLHAVRSAMDAERAPEGAGERQAEVVRSRIADFETALRAFRAGANPVPR